MTEPEKYRYPEHERFRRIAAKIADRCMLYDMDQIGPGGPNCPLGAALGGGIPNSSSVTSSGLMSYYESISFTRAFDGMPRLGCIEKNSEPFYRLGYAYRQRYTRLRPA